MDVNGFNTSKMVSGEPPFDVRNDPERQLAQARAAMDVQADAFKRRTADLENQLADVGVQRDDLLSAMKKLSGMKLNVIADGIVDKAISNAKGGA
jgi:hypothetical protein